MPEGQPILDRGKGLLCFYNYSRLKATDSNKKCYENIAWY